jgi:hypothetical protein
VTHLRRALAALAIALAVPAAAAAQSGIVYGDRGAFRITAPDGWVLDTQSGVPDGVHAAIYPNGGSWSGSPVVMYAHAVDRDANASAASVIGDDVAEWKQRFADLQVTDAGTLPTAGGKPAAVRYFVSLAGGSWEAVAYVEEPRVVSIVVMTSRTRAGFDQSLPAFAALVNSYAWMVDPPPSH